MVCLFVNLFLSCLKYSFYLVCLFVVGFLLLLLFFCLFLFFFWLGRKTSDQCECVYFQWKSLFHHSWSIVDPAIKVMIRVHIHTIWLGRSLFFDIYFNIHWVCRRVARTLIELRSLIWAVDHHVTREFLLRSAFTGSIFLNSVVLSFFFFFFFFFT